ncbi:MAG: hypothetical protein DI539_19730 [Flavobacterium psychrophilum]|nr:MAG: hypothetical protein DI539_19730 [Flavobacterium psychrophilum]
MKSSAILLIPCITLSIACDRHECKTNNSVFEHFEPETREYKEELLMQLNKLENKKTSYFLEGYIENDTIPSLRVKIEADGLCATAIVDIWRKDSIVNAIIKTKGNGYINAELKDFKMIMTQNCTKTKFIYSAMTDIID